MTTRQIAHIASQITITRVLRVEQTRFSVAWFQNSCWNPPKPVVLEQCFSAQNLPAMRRWFRDPTEVQHDSSQSGRATLQSRRTLNSQHFEPYLDTIVTLERTRSVEFVGGKEALKESPPDAAFARFEAPLGTFIDWVSENPSKCDERYYLAQNDISSLPMALQQDLETPDLVLKAGKGDIYASSIWLGLAPTRTPLHKDPNHNLFVQMAGTKTIRLVELGPGKLILEVAKRAAADRLDQGRDSVRSSAIRGEEMMGLEGRITDKLIWTPNNSGSAGETNDIPDSIRAFEAHLNPGDGLFIPQGWWHSVRGSGEGINASVNWWFR